MNTRRDTPSLYYILRFVESGVPPYFLRMGERLIFALRIKLIALMEDPEELLKEMRSSIRALGSSRKRTREKYIDAKELEAISKDLRAVMKRSQVESIRDTGGACSSTRHYDEKGLMIKAKTSRLGHKGSSKQYHVHDTVSLHEEFERHEGTCVYIYTYI